MDVYAYFEQYFSYIMTAILMSITRQAYIELVIIFLPYVTEVSIMYCTQKLIISYKVF